MINVDKFERKSKNNDTKFFNILNSYTYKCKRCNRSVVLGMKDRKICPNCGYYVYKNDMLEFRYKMKEKLLKQEKEDKNE